MNEPGSKTPQVQKEDCWALMCPVLYCSANPGQPCMNYKGYFALNTHKLRRERFENPVAERGPGSWSKRPQNSHGGNPRMGDAPHFDLENN